MYITFHGAFVIKKCSMCFSVRKHLSAFVSVVSLLKDLKHANIVTLHDIVHTDKSLTLVFEYLVRLTASPCSQCMVVFVESFKNVSVEMFSRCHCFYFLSDCCHHIG